MDTKLDPSEVKRIYYGINKVYAQQEIYHRQLKEKKRMRPTIWNILPFVLLVVSVVYTIIILIVQAAGG